MDPDNSPIEKSKSIYNIYSQPKLFTSPLKEINPRDRLNQARRDKLQEKSQSRNSSLKGDSFIEEYNHAGKFNDNFSKMSDQDIPVERKSLNAPMTRDYTTLAPLTNFSRPMLNVFDPGTDRSGVNKKKGKHVTVKPQSTSQSIKNSESLATSLGNKLKNGFKDMVTGKNTAGYHSNSQSLKNSSLVFYDPQNGHTLTSRLKSLAKESKHVSQYQKKVESVKHVHSNPKNSQAILQAQTNSS
jgi:hypothetical protein